MTTRPAAGGAPKPTRPRPATAAASEGAPDRTLPQDVDAERGVLGGMMISKDVIADVVEVLRGADFYRPAHELVYEAVIDLYGRGEPADAITVANELTKRGELGRIGGAPYLHTLIATVPTAANAGYYARIVREKAVARQHAAAFTRGLQVAADPAVTPETLAAVAADVVSSLTTRATPSSGLPQPVVLADFLATPDDEEQRWRIDDLWPSGGKVVLVAQYKVGKTTMVGNAVRALTDGGLFLGRFPVEQAESVTLIDDELAPAMLRRWLREQGIARQERANVLPLRGRLSSFNILDTGVRKAWAEALRGTQVLILDCLRPILDALGLDENHDAGRFLEALDELVLAAGISEVLVVHHAGHSGQRSRGDSRILDWPDAVWNLRRDGEDGDLAAAPRFFSALGRDVDVTEDELAFGGATRALTLTGTGSRAARRRNQRLDPLVDVVVSLIRAHPGASGAEVGRLLKEAKDAGTVTVTSQKGDELEALRRAEGAGMVRREEGPRNAKLYFVASPPPTSPDLPRGGMSSPPPTSPIGGGGSEVDSNRLSGHVVWGEVGSKVPTQRRTPEDTYLADVVALPGRCPECGFHIEKQGHAAGCKGGAA